VYGLTPVGFIITVNHRFKPHNSELVANKEVTMEVLFMKINFYLVVLILGLMYCSTNSIAKDEVKCDLTPYSTLDKQPRAIFPLSPHYPVEAKKNKITGKIVAQLIITKEGKPVNISIIESEPPGIFDESAIDAIKKYKFTPGIKNGVPVNVCINLPIVFDLLE
jgi:TonB family protein